MKRFISKMAAACMVFVSVFAFVAVSVNADTLVAGDVVKDYVDFTSTNTPSTISRTINDGTAGTADNYFTATSTGNYTYTLNGVSCTKAIKLNSSGAITFKPAYKTWSITVWTWNKNTEVANISIAGNNFDLVGTSATTAAESISTTGTGKATTSILRGSYSKEIVLAAVEITYTLSAEDFVAAFDVTYYDAADTTVAIGTESVDSGALITDIPTSLGKNATAYYTDAELKVAFDPTTDTITAATNIYVVYANWTETGDGNSLTTTLMTKLATQMSTALAAETALPGSIYTFAAGTIAANKTIILPGTTEAAKYDGLNTNGSLQSAKNYIQIDVPSSGVLVAYGCANGASRSMILQTAKNTDAADNVAANDGSVVAAAAANDILSATWNVTAGTYYLGGTNGITFQYVSFINGAQTGKQEGTAAVRFVARTPYAFADIEAVGFDFVSVTDSKSVTKDCTTVYTSLTVNSVGTIVDAETGYLYFAYTVTGFTTNYEMTAQAWVQVNGVKVYGEVVTYTFTAE